MNSRNISKARRDDIDGKLVIPGAQPQAIVQLRSERSRWTLRLVEREHLPKGLNEVLLRAGSSSILFLDRRRAARVSAEQKMALGKALKAIGDALLRLGLPEAAGKFYDWSKELFQSAIDQFEREKREREEEEERRKPGPTYDPDDLFEGEEVTTLDDTFPVIALGESYDYVGTIVQTGAGGESAGGPAAPSGGGSGGGNDPPSGGGEPEPGGDDPHPGDDGGDGPEPGGGEAGLPSDNGDDRDARGGRIRSPAGLDRGLAGLVDVFRGVVPRRPGDPSPLASGNLVAVVTLEGDIDPQPDTGRASGDATATTPRASPRLERRDIAFRDPSPEALAVLQRSLDAEVASQRLALLRLTNR